MNRRYLSECSQSDGTNQSFVGTLQAATVIVACAGALTGCRIVNTEQLSGKSPLAPLEKAPEQVDFEVVFVRLPSIESKTAQKLWEEVDEQAVASGGRRQWVRNGFRAGIVGRRLPEALAELIESAETISGGGAAEFAEVDSAGATSRNMFLHPAQRGELLASSVQPAFHVLQRDGGEIQGETFKNGQALFAIRAAHSDDGRIRIRLVPEVHHGSFRQRYVPGEGMFRLDTSRDKKVFDKLALDVAISAGEVLVLGSQLEKQGSLGHRFFNESSGAQSYSKLLLLRAGATRRNEFSPKDETAKNFSSDTTETSDP